MKLYGDNASIWLGGVCDSCAMVYPSAVIVKTRHPAIKAHFKRVYGGTIEPSRWILKSVKQRRRFLDDWNKWSVYRSAEIEAALDNLGSA